MAHESQLKWKPKPEAQESLPCPRTWQRHFSAGGCSAPCWGPSELVSSSLGHNIAELMAKQKVIYSFFFSHSFMRQMLCVYSIAMCPAVQVSWGSGMIQYNPCWGLSLDRLARVPPYVAILISHSDSAVQRKENALANEKIISKLSESIQSVVWSGSCLPPSWTSSHDSHSCSFPPTPTFFLPLL